MRRAPRQWKYFRLLRPDHFLLPVSLLLVILSGFLSHRDDDILRRSTSEVERLNRLIYANDRVLSGLKDMETGQRGYLLTGKQVYLEPFDGAVAAMPRMLENLRKELADPLQKERFQRLVILVSDKRAETEATLLTRNILGADAALAIVQTDKGRDRMEAIRTLCAEINQQARQKLVADSNEVADHQRQASSLSLAITITLFLLLTLGAATIQRGVNARDQLIDQLDNSRQQLETTLSSIGDGVVVTDAQGKVTFLNPVASRISGWAGSDVIGKSVEEVLPLLDESTRGPIENPVRQVLRDKRPARLRQNAVLTRSDGVLVPIDDSAAPILGSSGAPDIHGAVLVIRDITERRQAENSLRKWEQVFQHAGFGMAILDLDDEASLRQANPALAAMHGFTPEELEGAPLSLLVFPDAWEAELQGLRDAEITGHIVTQSVHRRKDGTRFPALADVTVVSDPNGNTLYAAAYYSDITERMETENELRRNEARFRTLADSLPQLVWTSLPDGTSDYFNSRWQEATGYNPAAVPQQTWHDFLHPEDREPCLAKWHEALALGTVFQGEYRLRQMDHHRWYICRAIPVRGNSGEIIRWFGSCTDIHDNKQVAEALRLSTNELRRSNLDLEQFAYAASHDLQEPLRMVVIYSQLLKEEFSSRLDDKALTYLNFAVEGALRMESLIRDLLAYSRASSPADTPQGGVLVTGAVNDALSNLKLQIEQSHAKIVVGELPRLHVPEIHLSLVFQNLISNAVKYRRPDVDPEISITAVEKAGEWIFAVQDNGIGIDPQYYDHIFRVFRRLHGAEYPGTGIGLALCQRLIERNGGKIWVNSGPDSGVGSGSTFFFTLPARQSI